MKSWKINVIRLLIVLSAVYASYAFIESTVNPFDFSGGAKQGFVFWTACAYMVWITFNAVALSVKSFEED